MVSKAFTAITTSVGFKLALSAGPPIEEEEVESKVKGERKGREIE